VTIPGFQSLSYLSARSEDGIYTLVGKSTEGVRKRIRFASSKHARARLRLRHELSVLKVLEEYKVSGVLQPEDVETSPDNGITAIFKFRPVKSFQAYFDSVNAMNWWSRLGEILKFTQSLTKLLSKVHQAGIFRISVS